MSLVSEMAVNKKLPSGASVGGASSVTASTSQGAGKSDDITSGATNAVASHTAPNLAQSTVKSKATRSVAWICCAPCVFCRTSTIFRRTAFTTLTLIVTSLLVMSPILFLTQFALPARDCQRQNCIPKPHKTIPQTCEEQSCINIGSGIQSKMNWNADPCNNFEEYCCSNNHSVSLYAKLIRNPQETADSVMEHLIQQNTTSGFYRKLGRLFGSCLRLEINSSQTIKNVLNGELGGFIAPGGLVPISTTDLLKKFSTFGVIPIVQFVYELSHGRKPHINLVLQASILNSPVHENRIRWNSMKAPIAEYVRDSFDQTIAGEVVHLLLPPGLDYETSMREKSLIFNFISIIFKLKQLQNNHGNDTVLPNIEALKKELGYLDWEKLLPHGWKRPITLRSGEYFHQLGLFLATQDQRVINNGLLVLFALHLLPRGPIDPKTCTKATVWALPDAASALFMNQFTKSNIESSASMVETIFEALKAHIKRAPTLRGRALVQLSSLKISPRPDPKLFNKTIIEKQLKRLEISSDDWFQNIINIFRAKNETNIVLSTNVTVDDQLSWSFPMLSKPFYDPVAHSVLVPAALTAMPYFDGALPKYILYSTVGVQIAKEIFLVTKILDDSLKLKCAPDVIDDESIYNRKSILNHAAALQIAYHALLHQSGSLERLAQLDLSPMQIMLIVAAQEFVEENLFYNYSYNTTDINEILFFLIAQGNTGSKAFSCPNESKMNKQKLCDVW